ncbi:MAG TPA: hypothetical protein VG367_18995 [Mucilaginibacter sp.]|jgi:hypothetical protein|nr:hypothetical protein [Mucilaginibacter sp.]
MPIKYPKLIFLAAFLLLSNAIFAQKDSIAFKIPTESDKVVYSGTVAVNNKTRAMLDTTSKAWFNSYFKYRLPVTPAGGQDTSSVFSKGMLEYKVRPGMVNIPFFCQLTIRIICKDNSYTYRISDIYFRPQNEFLNASGFENSPDYLVKVGRKKHLGLGTAWNVTRGQIREYLTKMDANIRACIASLNQAMTAAQ